MRRRFCEKGGRFPTLVLRYRPPRLHPARFPGRPYLGRTGFASPPRKGYIANMKSRALVTAMLTFFLLWGGCTEPPPVQPKVWLYYEWKGLFTNIRLTLEAVDSAQGLRLRDSLDQRFARYTQDVQTNSALDQQIFAAPVGERISLSDDFCQLFRYGQEKYYSTQGRIHVGIGNLLHAYGLIYGMAPHLPPDDTLAIERKRLQTLFYQLPAQSCTMEIKQSGAHYALGSFAKGYAIDLGGAILDRAGIQNWYLEAGGDLATRGHNPKGKAWTLGLQDPNRKDGVLAAMRMAASGRDALATSGGYENYFIDAQGNKHHHILDPLTARSITDKKSVSAFAAQAVDADFWATYLFVLPFDSACQRVEAEPGLEAVILSADDSLFVSSGLKDRFELLPRTP